MFGLHKLTRPYVDKSHFGFLRLLHFLALAYLAILLLQNRRTLLEQRWAGPFIRAGQHSLPVFLLSLALSYIAGMVLDQTGRNPLNSILISIGGVGILFIAAYVLAWFKSKPWQLAAPAAEPVRPAGATLVLSENRTDIAAAGPETPAYMYSSAAD
jgi:hypothetical protein